MKSGNTADLDPDWTFPTGIQVPSPSLDEQRSRRDSEHPKDSTMSLSAEAQAHAMATSTSPYMNDVPPSAKSQRTGLVHTDRRPPHTSDVSGVTTTSADSEQNNRGWEGWSLLDDEWTPFDPDQPSRWESQLTSNPQTSRVNPSDSRRSSAGANASKKAWKRRQNAETQEEHEKTIQIHKKIAAKRKAAQAAELQKRH